MTRIAKTSLLIWLLCLLGFFITISIVIGVRNETFDNAPDYFGLILLCFFLVGTISFLTMVISHTLSLLRRHSTNKQKPFLVVFKLLVALALFPLYLVLSIINFKFIFQTTKKTGIKGLLKHASIKKVIKNLVALTAIIGILLPLWIGGYIALWAVSKEALGYNPESISISGTGSMFPTFPKGEGKDPSELSKQVVSTPGMFPYPNGLSFQGKRYFNHQIGRGDIVVVENEMIRELTQNMYGHPGGWVKRVIGLPGDTIELREGIVYLNSQPLAEPYTAKPRSTFGESFLSECRQVVIPPQSLFLMGDNRKGSGDSREIGFIDFSSVNHVLPLNNQIGKIDQFWRDTQSDFLESAKIKLDKTRYVELLNQKRIEAGVKPLKYQEKLELSATKRGEVILEFADFSFEATQSGYTMAKAMQEVRYSNIVWGEAPTQGYFEAEELIDNQFQFPDSKKFLTDKVYQEVGIAEVEGSLNGCPTQVIVQHFAGYVPPNYPKEDIEAWRLSLDRLKEIQPGWSQLKDYPDFYQKHSSDIDRINTVINTRIQNIQQILSRMEANQWFTSQEKSLLNQDSALYQEQEALANKLNSTN